MDINIEKIHELKYNEMQKLAKSVGIKANMKFDRLKTALIEYHEKENKENSSSEPENNTAEKEKEVEDDEVVFNIKEEKCVETTSTKGRRKAKSKRTVKNKKENSNILQEKQVQKLDNSDTKESKSAPAPVEKKKGLKKLKSSVLVKKNSPVVKTPVLDKNTPVAKATLTSVKPNPTPKTPSFKPKTTSKDSKYTPLAIKNKQELNTPIGSGQKRKNMEDTIENPAKRTRMSFEKSELPNEPSPRPSSRRSTYSVEKTKKQDKKASVSPGVKDLVSAMDTEKSDEEMKQNLIQALDRKVQEKVLTMDKKEKVTNSTQIPRFAAFLEKKRQEQKKPITPGNKDWTKIHQKEFEKFDSIDVYLEKKRKHREETSMSVKKARMLVEQTKEAIKRLQGHKTPAKENKPRKSRAGLPTKSPGKDGFKPTVFSTKQMNLNFTQTRKSPRSSGSTFKPTITSTDKMNLNFGEMKTPSNSETKTPRTDPRKSTGSMAQRKSFATPFKFTGSLNVTVDGSRSVKKPSFDLKASLSKPMSWKTHKGKLKSLNETYLNNSAKSSKVQAREERRNSVMNKRTDIKFNSSMNRRGIAM